jgi:hypothetical protein
VDLLDEKAEEVRLRLQTSGRHDLPVAPVLPEAAVTLSREPQNAPWEVTPDPADLSAEIDMLFLPVEQAPFIDEILEEGRRHTVPEEAITIPPEGNASPQPSPDASSGHEEEAFGAMSPPVQAEIDVIRRTTFAELSGRSGSAAASEVPPEIQLLLDDPAYRGRDHITEITEMMHLEGSAVVPSGGGPLEPPSVMGLLDDIMGPGRSPLDLARRLDFDLEPLVSPDGNSNSTPARGSIFDMVGFSPIVGGGGALELVSPEASDAPAEVGIWEYGSEVYRITMATDGFVFHQDFKYGRGSNTGKLSRAHDGWLEGDLIHSSRNISGHIRLKLVEPSTMMSNYRQFGSSRWGSDIVASRQPQAVVGLDIDGDGSPDVLVAGVDRNRDGIPDVLQDQDAVDEPAVKPPPVKRRRRQKRWFDHVTEIPRETYRTAASAFTQDLEPTPYPIYLPHRLPGTFTTASSEMTPLLLHPLEWASEVGRRRRQNRANGVHPLPVIHVSPEHVVPSPTDAQPLQTIQVSETVEISETLRVPRDVMLSPGDVQPLETVQVTDTIKISETLIVSPETGQVTEMTEVSENIQVVERPYSPYVPDGTPSDHGRHDNLSHVSPGTIHMSETVQVSETIHVPLGNHTPVTENVQVTETIQVSGAVVPRAPESWRGSDHSLVNGLQMPPSPAGEDVKYFFDWCANVDAAADDVAKGFYDLLTRHMDGKIIMVQDEPYGDIVYSNC